MRSLELSRSVPDLLRAVSELIEHQLMPLPLVELASLRIETREDLELWVDRISALSRRPHNAMSGDEEDRLNGLLSCLLVASIRARMLAREPAVLADAAD